MASTCYPGEGMFYTSSIKYRLLLCKIIKINPFMGKKMCREYQIQGLFLLFGIIIYFLNVLYKLLHVNSSLK